MGNNEGYEKYRYDGRVLYGTVTDGIGEHAVEDARTQRGRDPEKETEPNDKRRRNPGRHRKRAIVVCLTIFLFSLTVFLADILSGSATIADYVALFKNVSESAETYYAVYATHSTDIGISYKNASAIQAEGGAGYVMKKGDDHYVIVSAYTNKEDAENVVKKHGNYGITELKVYPFSAEKCPALSISEAGSDLYKKAYDTLYAAANDMASDVYGVSELKKKVSALREEVAAYEESFRSSVSGKEDTVSIEYKVQLKEMIAACDNILQHEKGLVAEARYYSVMILHSYSIFSEKYFK